MSEVRIVLVDGKEYEGVVKANRLENGTHYIDIEYSNANGSRIFSASFNDGKARFLYDQVLDNLDVGEDEQEVVGKKVIFTRFTSYSDGRKYYRIVRPAELPTPSEAHEGESAF